MAVVVEPRVVAAEPREETSREKAGSSQNKLNLHNVGTFLNLSKLTQKPSLLLEKCREYTFIQMQAHAENISPHTAPDNGTTNSGNRAPKEQHFMPRKKSKQTYMDVTISD